MNTLKNKLKKLKLAGVAETIDTQNRYAIDKNISYMEFLELIIDDELANRESNSYKKRLSTSKLHTQKTLETFDFSVSELEQREIMDLALCNFLAKAQNLIFMGNPGTGKSHLANALGLQAIQKGKNVLFTDTTAMLNNLYASRADGTYKRVIAKYIKPDLLILDEIGFKQLNREVMDDLFEIVKSRYEENSIIITTNRNFEEWGDMIGDDVLASAIIDRLLHHSKIFKLKGNSYRMKKFVA